jgi:YihY family inner membrane protein
MALRLLPMSLIVPDSTETPESNQPGSSQPELPLKPFEDVKSVIQGNGFGADIVALARYMARTEVHTYAFSVAANAILSLFPFIVLILTISRNVFHSREMEQVAADMMKNLLPVGKDFVIRNMQLLTHPHKGTQVFSVVMLLITSTGVFLPLEVALNGVWGVRKNRSYLHNQAVSLGLALAVGILAMIAVASSASQQTILSWIFVGHTDNIVFRLISFFFLRICAALASILIFFLIYWVLPYRRIPPRAVVPTAIVVGLLWQLAKVLYIKALPWLDFESVYGPFYISVGLMTWAFLSGLLLLAGAHFSATRYTLKLARQVEAEEAASDAKSE